MSVHKVLGTADAAKRRKAAPSYNPVEELREELVKLILRVDHLEAAVVRLDRFTTHQLKDLGDRVEELRDV